MISKDRSYKAYNPKKTKTGKTMFSVMDYDKNNPTAKRYVTVFCQNEIELYDKQKVIIKEITGIGLSEYNGKQQVSMFALVLPDQDELQAMAGDVKVDISSDDLPFWFMETFGQRVEKLRNKYNHTRDELAMYLGVTQKIVYNIEKSISEPNLKTIELLCKRYKVSADYLLFGELNGK